LSKVAGIDNYHFKKEMEKLKGIKKGAIKAPLSLIFKMILV